MSIVREIQQEFALLGPDRYSSIPSLAKESPGWTFRDGNCFGVAVPIPEGGIFSERFAGTRLRTKDEWFDGRVHHLLRLECRKPTLRNEFAVVCAQFLEPGEQGTARQSLAADPAGWWQRWRELLGNVVQAKTPYSVLGELLTYEKIREYDPTALWMGPKSGSHDIESQQASYEVKSTISRYSMTIHISGNHQLAFSGVKPLTLVHFRFEQDPEGESVDATVGRLAGLGLDMDELEDLLESCGLEAGGMARKVTYRVLDARRYPVGPEFPRITDAMFPGGALPAGITRIEYEVNLATLEGTSFE